MSVPRKTVVIGGATGIGAATVARLVAAGDQVTVVDRVRPEAGNVAFVSCDLLDETQVADAVEALPEDVGALAYVAGIPGTRPAPDVLTVNFLALRDLLHAATAKLRDGAAIAVVTSIAGAAWPVRTSELEPLLATASSQEGREWLRANPSEYPIYSTSKEAAILFSKRLAFQLWNARAIRVNTVSPGPVETAILQDFERSMGAEVVEGTRAIVGRHALPTDIAPVIQAVLSPEFGWVNGQDVVVDGGSINAYMSGSIQPESVAEGAGIA